MYQTTTRILSAVSIAALATVLSACAIAPEPRPYSAGGYPTSQPNPAYVEYGRVANIETFRTSERNPSGAGAVIGGIMGAVVGNQIGSGGGRALATAAGVVGGAVVGNHVEGNNRREIQESFRISVQVDNGSYRAYDVPTPGDLRVGDRVRLQGGEISRL